MALNPPDQICLKFVSLSGPIEYSQMGELRMLTNGGSDERMAETFELIGVRRIRSLMQFHGGLAI